MIAIITTGFLDTRTVCDRVGVTPALLRLWESRYGWPSPRRDQSGQRRFTEDEVDELTMVVRQVQAGQSISSVLRNREVRKEVAARQHLEPLGERALGLCPEPDSAHGRRIRDRLVQALRQRNVGQAEACCHEALRCCRPAERTAAVRDPLLVLVEAWGNHGRPLAGADSLMALVDQYVGNGEDHSVCVA